MWDYSGYSNYHALQTSITRRFDQGLIFSSFYVWSKALGINSDDFTAGVAEPERGGDAPARLLVPDYDRPHNFVVNLIYQTPKSPAARRAVANDWQISGIYRWTSGRPYTMNFNRSRPSALPISPAPTATRRPRRAHLRSGRGWSGDPYQQLDTSCFAPPQPGSDGAESARFFVRLAADQQRGPFALEELRRLSKERGSRSAHDMFNALNHTQFTGVNSTVNFASLTDRTITNLPPQFERRGGKSERVRQHQRRGAAALVPARHADDVLGCPLVDSLRGRAFGSGPFFLCGQATGCDHELQAFRAPGSREAGRL